MEVEDLILIEEGSFSVADKVRLGGIVFRSLALDAPRRIFRLIVHLGDYSDERVEGDMALEDEWRVKTYRHVLKKEIGPARYRFNLTDQLHDIRERRGLPETISIDEM